MHRLTILYPVDDDPAAFRRYYEQTHVPLAAKMRGLTGWNLSWIEPGQRYMLVAELYTATSAAMDAVLASPEGQAASADLDNFVRVPAEFLRGDEVAVPLGGEPG